MRRWQTVVIAAAFSWVMALEGQQIAAFEDPERLSIENLYGRYSEAFVKKDYPALRECVQAPFVMLTDGELQTLTSADDVIAFLRNARESLERRGFDHGEVFDGRTTPLTADRGLINKSFRRYKKDGSLLEELAAVYLVTKSADGWKLRGLFRQELKYFGRVPQP